MICISTTEIRLPQKVKGLTFAHIDLPHLNKRIELPVPAIRTATSSSALNPTTFALHHPSADGSVLNMKKSVTQRTSIRLLKIAFIDFYSVDGTSQSTDQRNHHAAQKEVVSGRRWNSSQISISSLSLSQLGRACSSSGSLVSMSSCGNAPWFWPVTHECVRPPLQQSLRYAHIEQNSSGASIDSTQAPPVTRSNLVTSSSSRSIHSATSRSRKRIVKEKGPQPEWLLELFRDASATLSFWSPPPHMIERLLIASARPLNRSMSNEWILTKETNANKTVPTSAPHPSLLWPHPALATTYFGHGLRLGQLWPIFTWRPILVAWQILANKCKNLLKWRWIHVLWDPLAQTPPLRQTPTPDSPDPLPSARPPKFRAFLFSPDSLLGFFSNFRGFFVELRLSLRVFIIEHVFTTYTTF